MRRLTQSDRQRRRGRRTHAAVSNPCATKNLEQREFLPCVDNEELAVFAGASPPWPPAAPNMFMSTFIVDNQQCRQSAVKPLLCIWSPLVYTARWCRAGRSLESTCHHCANCPLSTADCAWPACTALRWGAQRSPHTCWRGSGSARTILSFRLSFHVMHPHAQHPGI